MIRFYLFYNISYSLCDGNELCNTINKSNQPIVNLYRQLNNQPKEPATKFDPTGSEHAIDGKKLFLNIKCISKFSVRATVTLCKEC